MGATVSDALRALQIANTPAPSKRPWKVCSKTMTGQGSYSHRTQTGETGKQISGTDMRHEDKVGHVNGADGYSGG